MRTKMNFTPDLTIGLEAKSSLAQNQEVGGLIEEYILGG